ncbi:MAG: PH domain-containing protein, partial [Thermoplasmata archaeon]|nr:PH domain-containing protein [Thermoplasmata archaeon]
TSTLMFNVNSGVNATVSEATLVLKRDEADALRDRLSSMIFHKEVTVEEDREIETLVEVSNLDIILHATLAQPTYQAIFGLVMLVYAILSLFQENSGGFLSAVVLFAITEAIPFIQVILKYANYRLYRVGDTVTVESGLLSTSRRSFRTNKVNSVRVREPMLARIIGKATLDAEVVGLAGGEGVPILCPLKKKAVVEDLANKLVPELVFEPEPEHQPARAIYPMIITDAVVSVISIAIGVWLFLNVNSRPDVNSFAETLLLLVEALFIVGIPLYRFGGSLLHQRQRMFAMGTESFMFVSGAFDMSTEYVSFDKVQIAAVRAGPLQRRFGLATCRVSQLSSVGFRSVESGLFPPEDLEAVPDEVMARIRDGRYDYRRYLRWYRTCL